MLDGKYRACLKLPGHNTVSTNENKFVCSWKAQSLSAVYGGGYESDV